MPARKPKPIAVPITATDKISKRLDKISGKIERLRAPIDNVRRAFKRLDKAAGLTNIGASLKRVGGNLTRFVTLPVTLLGGGVLKMAGDFEASMKNVQGVTGATGEDFDRLRKKAMELGRTTQFSASEAAAGMEFLGRAGFDVNKILKAIGPSLNLAAAEGVSLGESADLVSNILSQFGLEAKETARISELLSAAASSSNTNVLQLAEALKFGGPTLASMGFQAEEVVAVLGKLGDAGLQGSIASRALSTAFTKMAAPGSKSQKIIKNLGIDLFDASGEVKSMVGFFRDLENATKNMNAKQRAYTISTVFGQQAYKNFAAVLGAGADEIEKLQVKITGTDIATKKAALKMTGFNGALKAFRSAIEAAAIAIADSGILQFFTELITKFAKVFRSIAVTNPKLLKWGFILAAIAAAIGPLIFVLGTLITALGVLGPALIAGAAIITGTVIPAVFAFSAALLANPIFFIATGIILVIGLLVKFTKLFDPIVNKIKSFFGFIDKDREIGINGPDGIPETIGGNVRKHFEERETRNINRNEAVLKVDFENAPKGTNISIEKNKGVSLEANLGMVGSFD